MIVRKDSTDVTTYFQMRLLAGGDGTGLTISDFDLSYTRSGAATAAKVDAVALAAADTAHTDNRGIEVDATDCPGLYRFDWPDAAFATGLNGVILTVKHASCFTESLRIELVSYNPNDTVRLGLTALPNAAADAAGGLPISDAGGLDLDAQIGTDIDAILVDTGTTLQGEVDGIQADTEDIQTRLPAALTGGKMDSAMTAAANNVITASVLDTTAIAEIADGVWDEATVGHAGAGSTGVALTDILTDTGTTLDGKIDTIDGIVDSILVDTGTTLDTAIADLPTNAELATALGTADDAVLAAIAALNNLSAASVLTQVNSALDTAISELGVAAPTATPTLRTGLMLLYMALRNKVDVDKTALTKEVHNNAGTVVTTKTLSDDGTTYSETKMA
jgi:hypothetical protein